MDVTQDDETDSTLNSWEIQEAVRHLVETTEVLKELEGERDQWYRTAIAERAERQRIEQRMEQGAVSGRMAEHNVRLVQQVARLTRQLEQQRIPSVLDGIYADVDTERQRQIEKGWTRDHDDTHDMGDWLNLINTHARLALLPVGFEIPFRRKMVVVAALAIAAIEWHDRRVASVLP